ncbi:MAG: PEGA domain-containing protein [Myxococcaceae bacterium]|jgi:hypothetical protein|nr:PEGA domain-containing protein [Myxococcaceae bacterium]MCA3015950.1 PEGA domain-containing protein [Myxococcaceae bacterium]
MSSIAPLLLAVALAAAPGTDATAKAKQAFAEGQKLYLQGQFRQALARFEEAYALKPAPLLRYNVARCYERLDAPGPALRAYRDFLRLSPKPAEKEAVLLSMAALQRQLRASGVQQLLVLTEPPGADVEVDGKPLGLSPASVELPAGPHQVTAKRPGYAPVTRNVVTDTAAMLDVSLVLEAAMSPPPPPPPTPAVTAPPVPVPVVGAAEKPLEPSKDALREAALTPSAVVSGPSAVEAAAPAKRRVVTWVAGGVALAAVGVGVGLWRGAVGQSALLRDGTVRPQSDAQALFDSASLLNGAAVAAYGVAVASLVSAVVFFFVEGR